MINRPRLLRPPAPPQYFSRAFGPNELSTWYQTGRLTREHRRAKARAEAENRKRYFDYLRGYGREAAEDAAGGTGDSTKTVSTAAKTSTPSIQDIQKQYQELATRARDRDVSAPFAAARNTAALGRAMDLEALDRQRTQEEQMARAQAVDRGMEVLGGSPAAQQRFQQAVERGGQQYDQTAAQLGIQQAQAETRRDAQADAMEAQGIGVAGQFAMQEAQQNFQREVRDAQLEYQRTRDKQQYDLAVTQAERNFRATRWDAMMKEKQLAAQIAQINQKMPRRGFGRQQLTGTNIFSSPYGFDSEWS